MKYALNNKRIRVFLMCVWVVTMLLLCMVGSAQTTEPGLTFTLSVDPSTLTAPGEVTVSARVDNAGGEDITLPLSLYDPDGKLVTSFGDGGILYRLNSGESFPWQGKYTVKQSQLDDGKLVYTLRYSELAAGGALIGSAAAGSGNRGTGAAIGGIIGGAAGAVAGDQLHDKKK